MARSSCVRSLHVCNLREKDGTPGTRVFIELDPEWDGDLRQEHTLTHPVHFQLLLSWEIPKRSILDEYIIYFQNKIFLLFKFALIFFSST